MDLSNPDRLSFRDLPDDVAAGMFLAWRKGAAVECNYTQADAWLDCEPFWDPSAIYRIRPEPKTADVIPWAHIDPQWKWVARDKSVSWYGFKTPPVSDQIVWTAHGGWIALSGVVAGFIPGTCDWRDSLQQRPEGA